MAGSTNGTDLISGTPTAAGTTDVTITATNGIDPAATQTLAIVVDAGPGITSGGSGTVVQGGPGHRFTVTTGGFPAPSLGWSGTIPAGLSFTDNGNGTATISGTPTSAGTTPLTLLATNTYGATSQAFTLTVNPAPVGDWPRPVTGWPPPPTARATGS